MKTVRIEKTKLVEILTANAATHATDFDTAFRAWCIAQENKFYVAAETAANLASDDSFNAQTYVLPKPENHSDDYARALKKLSLSADDVIELDEGEYRQYVEDEWSWQRAFKHLVGTYAAG